MLHTDIKVFLGELEKRPPATDRAIESEQKQLNSILPPDYREFLKITNGGEGFIGKGSYVMLWSVEQLVSMNNRYEVEKYVQGLLLFGSNGGGEAYGFDTRDPAWPIVQVPFIGMDSSVMQLIGNSFLGFLQHLYNGE